MPVDVKICGINDPAALRAAVDGGARFVGLVVFPPSPRAVTPARAAELAAAVPAHVTPVALTVNAEDALIDEICAALPRGMLQLHGAETPARASEIRARTGRPVMKAIGVATRDDLARAAPYRTVVDWLLFDAKPPPTPDALPGGNALPFDWSLLAGHDPGRPWMLAGGLTADNLELAVARSGAAVVDVSSGVETAPGRKDPARIRALLEVAAGL